MNICIVYIVIPNLLTFKSDKMKKVMKLFSCLMLACSLFCLSSCGDDDSPKVDDNQNQNGSNGTQNGGEGNQNGEGQGSNMDTTRKEPSVDPQSVFDVQTTPSKKSVAEIKLTLQDNGLKFEDELSKMKNTKTSKALESYSSLNSDPQLSVVDLYLAPVFKAISGGSPKGVASTMRTLGTNQGDDDPETFGEVWDEVKGRTLSYNATTDEFDETANTEDQFVIEFPMEGSTSNNVELIIEGYEGHEVTNQEVLEDLEVDPGFDLPLDISASLKIDGVEEMSVVFEMEYDADDIPSDFYSEVFISPFTFISAFSNDGSELEVIEAFEVGDQNIFATAAYLQGDVSWDNINEALDTEDAEKLGVTEASYAYVIFDIALAVTVTDPEGLVNEIVDIEELYDWDNTTVDSAGTKQLKNEEDYAGAMESVINDHIAFDVFFIDTQEKIADTHIEMIVEEDEVICWQASEGTQEQNCFYDYWTEPNITMTFEDGTKMLADDFIETGFESLETALEDLIDEIEADFDVDFDEDDDIGVAPVATN